MEKTKKKKFREIIKLEFSKKKHSSDWISQVEVKVGVGEKK